VNFARDLQERLGILALLALSARFRICKLLIPLVDGETDPVSGLHLESTYKINPMRQAGVAHYLVLSLTF
jgi:hypothetical protein